MQWKIMLKICRNSELKARRNIKIVSRSIGRSQLIDPQKRDIFGVRIKISDFQIFIDSDREKSEFLYAIYCNPLAHLILAQKRTRKKFDESMLKKLPRF